MRLFKLFVIALITVAMPLAQVEAAFPGFLFDFDDVIKTSGEGKGGSAETPQGAAGILPPGHEGAGSNLAGAGGAVPEEFEELESALPEELPVEERGRFWTKRKALGLLLLLALIGGGIGLIIGLAGGGGGGGSGEGGGGGGSPAAPVVPPVVPPGPGPNPPVVPPGPVPISHPEPSTFALLGLGLLLPLLRKRKS